MFEIGDIVEYDHDAEYANPNFYVKLLVTSINTGKFKANFDAEVLEILNSERGDKVGDIAGSWAPNSFKKVSNIEEELFEALDKLELCLK